MRLQLSIRQGRRKDTAQHAAFADLHREHAHGVFNLAVRLLGDREEARDITQDVLLKAFERLGRPGELNQRAWLYRVTVNACYDHLRTLKRRPRTVEGGPELASGVDGFEQADLVRTVDAALRRLPPAQRAALLLREVHGLPTSEVAFALGTRADSAAVTLSRARRSFRRHFADLHGPDAEPATAATWRASAEPGTRAKVGALALGLWLPRLHLLQTPLPAELESVRLVGAASTTLGVAAGHGNEATFGVLARLAEALCTKAGAVGASATLITGSIGGAYAIENAARNSRTAPVAARDRPAATADATVDGPSARASRPPTPATAASPAPSGSPSPTASPAATPSGTPTPLTLGEATPTASPSPEPSPSVEPSATATPAPTPSGSPEPTPSPTSSSSPTPETSPTP